MWQLLRAPVRVIGRDDLSSPVGLTRGSCGLVELGCWSVLVLPFCRRGLVEAGVKALGVVVAQPGDDCELQLKLAFCDN